MSEVVLWTCSVNTAPPSGAGISELSAPPALGLRRILSPWIISTWLEPGLAVGTSRPAATADGWEAAAPGANVGRIAAAMVAATTKTLSRERTLHHCVFFPASRSSGDFARHRPTVGDLLPGHPLPRIGGRDQITIALRLRLRRPAARHPPATRGLPAPASARAATAPPHTPTP